MCGVNLHLLCLLLPLVKYFSACFTGSVSNNLGGLDELMFDSHFYRNFRYKRSDKKGRSPWAIKKANGNARQSIIKRLTTEGEILRSLNHPNIVTFKKLSHTAKGKSTFENLFNKETIFSCKISPNLLLIMLNSASLNRREKVCHHRILEFKHDMTKAYLGPC